MDTREGRPDRPARVIILDADDPMTEIDGEIVWREAHDRVVEDVRRRSYAEGHAAGMAQATASVQRVRLAVRRRRSLRWWIRAVFSGGVVVFVLLFLLLLLLPG